MDRPADRSGRHPIRLLSALPGRRDAAKYPKHEADSAVDGWARHLGSALKADAHRPVRERRTAKMLFEQIRSLGYGGSYARLTMWLRRWRAEQDGAPCRAAFGLTPIRRTPRDCVSCYSG